jgi:hypothetical protein
MTSQPEASTLEALRAQIASLKGRNRALADVLTMEIGRNCYLERRTSFWRFWAIAGWLAWLLMSVAWVLHFTGVIT